MSLTDKSREEDVIPPHGAFSRNRSAKSLRRRKPNPIATGGEGNNSPGVHSPRENVKSHSPRDVVGPLVRVHSDKVPDSGRRLEIGGFLRLNGPMAGRGTRQTHTQESAVEYESPGDLTLSIDECLSEEELQTDNSGQEGLKSKTIPRPTVAPTTKAPALPMGRRRPPGLGGVSILADAQEQIFGDDGTLRAKGFAISGLGIMQAPEDLKRHDSDGDSLEGVPRSLKRSLMISSLAELRTLKMLGAGANGRVNLSIHTPTGRQMAVKVVNVYDESKRNQILKELETLSSYASRFLVHFYGAFYDGKGAVHIVLEYMDCGALADVIARKGAIPENVTNHIAFHCLHGLNFLHQSRVLHRDLKSANILLSRETRRAKLSDFGLAREVNAGVSRADTFVGTLAYMSPERLHGSPYTYASDIWGLGVSIAECLLGRYPFEKPQSYFDYIAVATSNDRILPLGRFSPECEDFVNKCTAVDPTRRPQCHVLLKHPWITGDVRNPEDFDSWLNEVSG